MISKFRPINDDHAIERVVFTLELNRPLSEIASKRIADRHHEWRHELPAMTRPEGFEFEIGLEGVRTNRVPGVAFAFLQPDGSPVWALKAQGNEIAVECRRYSRWNKVWTKARNLFSMVLPHARDDHETYQVSKAHLVVQDAFLSPSSNYNLEELFSGSRYVPTHIFGMGPDWHVHTGWFEAEDKARILHNFNLDGVSSSHMPNLDGLNRVSIMHLLQWIPEAPVSYNRPDLDWLDRVMETLHQKNKDRIGDILTKEMVEKIALSHGEE